MKKQAFIVDLDGTLALKRAGDPNCRGIYDWKRVGEDVGFTPMLKVYTCISAVYRCLIVSGRNEICRPETLEWLKRYNIDTNEKHGFRLFMRPVKDHRPDYLVKEDIYREFIEPEYDIIAAFDDRTTIVKLWRDVIGVPTFQVDWGNF